MGVAYLASEGQHPLGGQEAEPDVPRIIIRRQPLLLIAPEVRGIQPVLVQAEGVGQAVEGPRDGLLLEVRAENTGAWSDRLIRQITRSKPVWSQCHSTAPKTTCLMKSTSLPETPVAKHLKEGVVVRVLAHLNT
jgi:hypothetical protein